MKELAMVSIVVGVVVDGGVVLMLVLLLVWVLDEWDFLLDFDETLVSVLDCTVVIDCCNVLGGIVLGRGCRALVALVARCCR